MPSNQLPKISEGKWIWLKEENASREVHMLFRRHFSLAERPHSAEIMVSAGSAFHLYVNGRHCLAGPAAGSEGFINLSFADITDYLQCGLNHIAVSVFNTSAPQSSQKTQPSGLWLQLNLNHQPYIWTDELWKCLPLNCYLKSGIERRFGAPDVEILDFFNYPHNWEQMVFTAKSPAPSPSSQPLDSLRHTVRLGDGDWKFPNVVTSRDDFPLKLQPSQSCDDFLTTLACKKLIGSGSACLERQTLWVNFRDMAPKTHGGVFIAETYIYAWEEGLFDVNCYCDRPYRLFLNEQIIIQQAPPPPPVRTDPRPMGDHKLAITDYVVPAITIHLDPGWNRMFLVIDCDSLGHGITIIWDDCPAGKLSIHTRPNTSSPAGWILSGPMKAPFALILPDMFQIPGKHMEFHLDRHPAWDISLTQSAYDFTENICSYDSSGHILLKQSNYVIFDTECIRYGYPQVSLSGAWGDVVDIVCGDHIQNNAVLAFDNGHRNTCTMILSGKTDKWISTLPHGFRYMMLVARNATNQITINSANVRLINQKHTATGIFDSSDSIFNQIWSTGAATLANTMRGGFIDSPCGEQTQFIADAMLQSWAACHLFGDYEYCEHSLRSFALSQIETGALNSSSPSGLFQIIPDYSLLWIIWLHRHIMYTGNIDFLNEMMPALDHLLAFFEHLAVVPDGPLPDMHSYNGLYGLLDLDNQIDMQGISTGLNAIYCKALQLAAELNELGNDKPLARGYRHRAANVAATLRSLTWDTTASSFADSYYNDAQSKHHAWQTNVLALYADLVPPSLRESLWDSFFAETPPFEKFQTGDIETPFFKYYVLETAIAMDKRQWALDFIRYYWGGMLKAGATTWWELFSPKWHLNQANSPRIFGLCQGYGVSPNGFLISVLAGLVPTAPGFSEMLFRPLLNAVDSLSVELPTVKGVIFLSWEHSPDGKIHVALDAPFAIRITPLISEEDARNAIFNLSRNILLAE